MTTQQFKNTFIEIPYTEIPNSHLWTNENQFATLYVEIDDIPPTQEPQTILFSIDISGSMSDICPDGRTKMQHIVHTTKNIIDVFSTTTTSDISVEIWGFDDKMEPIVKETKCTKETKEEIHERITRSLNPRGSTNISIALKNANDRLKNLTTNRTHVFMTDGQVTSGSRIAKQLKENVDPNYPNIFVGFGSDHDAFLLQTLANEGSYYYVDHIETAGLAYGEITHSILYQALRRVTITINGGEIYDYRTNTWSNTLEIPYLLGQAKKTYHLRYKKSTDLSATIRAFNSNAEEVIEEVDVLPRLLDAPPTDFTRHLYRQRTLELLYEAQKTIKEQQQNQRLKDITQKLNDFLIDMKSYIDQNNLTDDIFMADLCDDIGITMMTIKTSCLNVAAAYSAGRARSNGTQGSFQPVFRRTRHMKRNFNTVFLPENNSDLDSDVEENYIPRSTPLNRNNTSGRQIEIMTNLSQFQGSSQLFSADSDETLVESYNHL